MSRTSETGNVLFFILIAVVLFGALSFVVGNMLRSGSPETLTDQKSEINADEILGYAQQLRQGVQGLKISNACEDTDISFENTSVSGYDHSPVADDECKVFHPDGAGLSYQAPQDVWLDNSESASALYGEWFFPNSVCIDDIGSGGATCFSDAGAIELMMILPWVKKNICMEINEKIGIANDTDDAPTEANTGYASDKFVDTFTTGQNINSADLRFSGQATGCFKGAGASPAGGYHFYQVLRAR